MPQSECGLQLGAEKKAIVARSQIWATIAGRIVIQLGHIEREFPVVRAVNKPVDASGVLLSIPKLAKHLRDAAIDLDFLRNQKVSDLGIEPVIEELTRWQGTVALNRMEPAEEILAVGAEAAVLEGGIDRGTIGRRSWYTRSTGLLRPVGPAITTITAPSLDWKDAATDGYRSRGSSRNWYGWRAEAGTVAFSASGGAGFPFFAQRSHSQQTGVNL